MALMNETVWRGKIVPAMQAETHVATRSAGLGASGTGAGLGGTANLEAFTDTRWVTIRGDIAPYPF